MYLTYLKKVIIRDLQTLRAQVESYPDESQLWETREGVSNTGGTLALHLVGHKDVALYDGSWAEWGLPGDTPVDADA